MTDVDELDELDDRDKNWVALREIAARSRRQNEELKAQLDATRAERDALAADATNLRARAELAELPPTERAERILRAAGLGHVLEGTSLANERNT